MRIISGTKKGHRIFAPKNLPTRPTTDRSKESLFNIIVNRYNLENCDVLDLYAGTGNITYEFSSRGAKSVVCVDRFRGCTEFIKSESKKLGFRQVTVLKADVLKCMASLNRSFDLIFADPPFATQDYEKIHAAVFEYNLLSKNGLFVMEHHSVHDFSKLAHFAEARHYGQNVMSFYEVEQENEPIS